eukprot:1161265-Pelagomonas_calceolata.AAC.13
MLQFAHFVTSAHVVQGVQGLDLGLMTLQTHEGCCRQESVQTVKHSCTDRDLHDCMSCMHCPFPGCNPTSLCSILQGKNRNPQQSLCASLTSHFTIEAPCPKPIQRPTTR